ncbi:MAG: hypothetical protein ACLFVT_08670 [Syntrophobacteria bacterium]
MDWSKPPKKGTVLGVLAMVAALWVLVRFFGPDAEMPQVASIPQISPEKLADTPRQQDKEPVQEPKTWGRDPFVFPPGVTATAGTAREPGPPELKVEESGKPLPKVSAVVVSGSKRVAVIGDRSVVEGDLVNGARVARITLDGVVLHGAGGQRVLPVPRPKTRVTSQSARE